MSAIVWVTEWRLALADPRGLSLRVLGALAVAVVIATGGVPQAAEAAAFTALCVGYGVLRSASGILEDGSAGLARRVLSGGVGPASYLLQRAAASTALSLVGLLPALAVLALVTRPSPTEALVALGATALGLWVASVLGAVVGAVSRSSAELLVLSGVTLVLLLHMSGVFQPPAAGGLGAVMESASPFGMLHDALAGLVSGGRAGNVSAAVVWAVLLPTLTGLFAPRLAAFPARSS